MTPDKTLGFVENLSTAIDVLGLEHAPTAFVLARIPWESADDRDLFLADALAALTMGGGSQ